MSAPAPVPRALRPPGTYGPLPFHRLYRGLAGYQWWRPMVAILVGAAVYVVVSTAFLLLLIVIGVVAGSIDLGSTVQSANDALYGLIEIDAASPLSLVIALGSVALLLPSALIGQLAAGLRPLAVRHSVAFRIRGRWFLASLVPAFATVAAMYLIPAGISLIAGEAPFGPMTTDPALFAICAAIILMLTPLQAAAEEYVFRGMLSQALGAWVRFAPVGWVITTGLFVWGHYYDVWGLVSVGAFGLGASIVVWRTGGLEAGIALHSVNNVSAFLVLASGVQGTTVNASSASADLATNLISVGLAVVTTAGWVLWVDRLARRRGLARFGGMQVPVPPPSGVGISGDPYVGNRDSA